MYKEIDIDILRGAVSGYELTSKDGNYKVFLDKNIDDEDVLNKIISFIENKNYDNIVVIKNLNVKRKFRGQGVGKELLETAIKNSEIALLISDKYESQLKGFILDKFYESADFEKILDTSSGSLMLYPSSEAVKLKSFLSKKNIPKAKM